MPKLSVLAAFTNVPKLKNKSQPVFQLYLFFLMNVELCLAIQTKVRTLMFCPLQ